MPDPDEAGGLETRCHFLVYASAFLLPHAADIMEYARTGLADAEKLAVELPGIEFGGMRETGGIMDDE